jgi:hypothetical protein
MTFPATIYQMFCLRYIGLAILLAGLGTALAFAEAATDADDRVKELIVVVRSDFGGTSTVGAGIIFGTESDRIYILTANHNVRRGVAGENPAVQVVVQFRWLPAETVPATLLNSFDESLDLAVITVARQNLGASLQFDWLGDSDALSPGDSVYFVGHPKGNLWELTVRPSTVSRKDDARIYFQSEFVAPGNSGGGLFNENRELVGMVRKDDPPYGEAVSIVTALQWLQRFNYPILLSRPGSPNSLAAFEAEIAGDVKYNCLVLDIWPGDVNGADVAKRLSVLLAKVEGNPLFRHSRSAQIASLYRCMGAAVLISGEINPQIPLALPYLERSLESDPSQFILRRNVGTLQTIYRNGRGDLTLLATAVLQVLRGGDAPDIPEAIEKISAYMRSPERQAQDWLLHSATSSSLSEMLELMRLRVKNEGGHDFPLEVSTRTLDSGLIEVTAAIGPSNFIWEVDYGAKKFTAKNDLARALTDSVKPKK